MEKDKFIYFKTVEKMLNSNNYFGFTVKRNRENNRLLYKYVNIRYPHVLVSVLTMKLDPTKIQSDKIVLGIKFNDNEINGWNEFINELKNMYQKYHKKRPQGK